MLEQIRERILGNMMRDAAELMAWRGYDNVRASELAKATRMSVGTLYRHHGSKRGFALKVRAFTEHQLCRHAGIEFDLERSRSGPDFRLAFLRFWWELACFALLQPAMFCFTFLHWHPEDLQQEPRGTQVRALVRHVLSEGER